jgi:hypothetical protein
MGDGDMAMGGGPEPMKSDSKGWAAAAHLAPLIGLGFIAPLVIWLIKKEEDPYVEWHARHALNFQITFLIAAIASGILILLIIGIILLPIVIIAGVVMEILAGVKAANGERWPYPINIQFVK